VTPERFDAITSQYSRLRVAVVGDFCLDRYLEIDPARKEVSIETGLPVHNVVRIRSQPGAAGTILNNLTALGVAEVFPIGFAGDDGEGFELKRALASLPGVYAEGFLLTAERRTFTYTKPLVISPGQPPRELNRLDSKNWSPTPSSLQRLLVKALRKLARRVDAIIILDQVEVPETGVISQRLLEAVRAIKTQRPRLLILADSRRGLQGYPAVCLKMNRAELSRLAGKEHLVPLRDVGPTAAALAQKTGNYCFVTLAEKGIVGGGPEGAVERLAALPLRGKIDIVGAGDCVSANLAAALAAGASLREALQLANAASSVVVHKLGTTGTASVAEIGELLPKPIDVRAAFLDVINRGAAMPSALAREAVVSFLRASPRRPDAVQFSPRERDLLEFVAKGYSNKEIADQIQLSVETVRSYLKRLYEKMHVHSRTEAAVRYVNSKSP
jgi:rfaE bifunctional protein kinase chain/domain